MERIELEGFPGLYVLVERDAIELASHRRSMFVGERAFDKVDGKATTVHVISTHAKGEIRGYFLIRGRLHLRLPSYPREWPEIDAATMRVLGASAVEA